MDSIRRLTLVSLLAGALASGCESGSAESFTAISFAPTPAPAGTGFVEMVSHAETAGSGVPLTSSTVVN